MQFDALVAALPLSSEEDQLKRIRELQIYINLPGIGFYVLRAHQAGSCN
jgi:hypothetical protein